MINTLAYFRYCPNCRLLLNNEPPRIANCQHCGFHLYLAPAITNALILENRQGEILLTKRKLSPKKGYWDLPGGFVNFKETVEESLKREIKEELNLDIKKIIYFGSYWSYYPYKGINYQTLCLVFIASYVGGKIEIRDDVIDYRFFSKKDIDFKKISFDDVRNALKDYFKQ